MKRPDDYQRGLPHRASYAKILDQDLEGTAK